MLLAIDAGNSNIVVGLIENDEIIKVFRVSTDTSKTEDEYLISFRQLMDVGGVDYKKIDGAIICSVVPPIKSALTGAVKMMTGVDPLIVSAQLNTGLNIDIDNPAQLGSDLIADAVAAVNDYPLPAIVFDMGTATTISVIDRNSRYLGGVIMPGLRLSLNALSSNTSQLPKVSIEAPESCIGRNTVDCMKSGSIFGAASMMDGMIERIEDELGEKATVIATGGLAQYVVAECRRNVICDDNLLLRGLNKLYRMNK
ncbi:MAG: type III pantothenate kinase [Clostridia bacterium]|nr:type III pantothenate kinase [Clostridia bacterium]